MLLNYKERLNEIDSSDVIKRMSDHELKELQQVLFEMFLDLSSVCKKHNIELFAVGGTFLGAIRHKGFIPWDDDFDVGMLRDDYEKFKGIFDKELGTKYVLNSPNYSKKVLNRFPKILKKNTVFKDIYTKDNDLSKIYIDIFILDRIPDNILHMCIKGIYCNMLMFVAGQVFLYESRNEYVDKLYCRVNVLTYYFKLIVGFVFSFLSYSKWNNIIDKAVQYNGDTSLYGLTTGRKHYFGDTYEEFVLFPLAIYKFNDVDINGFNNYDKYLSNLYGDYMKIPPENKREKHFIKEIRF